MSVYIETLEHKYGESPSQSRRRGSGSSGRETEFYRDYNAEVLRQVLADSDSKEEYSPSDEDAQSAAAEMSAPADFLFLLSC